MGRWGGGGGGSGGGAGGRGGGGKVRFLSKSQKDKMIMI